MAMFLIAAAAVLSPADAAAVDTAIAAIYRPYRADPSNPTAVWDRPIWSAAVRALIAQWQKVIPKDEPDSLNDGDWLCQCQDWDDGKFTARVLSRRALGPGLAEATVRVDLGFGDTRDVRLVMRREGRAWKIDEMTSDSFPKGLRHAIRETTAADRKLREGARE